MQFRGLFMQSIGSPNTSLARTNPYRKPLKLQPEPLFENENRTGFGEFVSFSVKVFITDFLSGLCIGLFRCVFWPEP